MITFCLNYLLSKILHELIFDQTFFLLVFACLLLKISGIIFFRILILIYN